MKAILVMLAAIALARTSFADVLVIKSVINGTGQQTGETLNVISPTITLGGVNYKLSALNSTAHTACRLLGLRYQNHSVQESENVERIATLNSGALSFASNSRSIDVLSCRK